jgi:uncharacterized membrane protein YkgB
MNKNNLKRIDKRIATWMEKYGHRLLRYSLAIIFIWFGALKIIPGLSPAEELVKQTVFWIGPWFIPFLGLWEVTIGLCLLWRPLIRVGIGLMAIQMIGTVLPLIYLPSITWKSIFVPTLEGQYIIKNVTLIAAAIAVGGTVNHKKGKLKE